MARWVFNVLFGSTREGNEVDEYILQVFHCLRGKRGVCPFVGVIHNDDGLVGSFMYGIPKRIAHKPAKR